MNNIFNENELAVLKELYEEHADGLREHYLNSLVDEMQGLIRGGNMNFEDYEDVICNFKNLIEAVGSIENKL